MAQVAEPVPNPARDTVSSCAPDAACNCGPTVAARREMSWPAVVGIVAGGSVFCLLIVKLLGA